MLALTNGTAYIERVALSSPLNIRKAKKALKKAFQIQIEGKGFSLIEILSPCPTNWKMSSIDAFKWVDDVLSKEFPLGVIKDTTGKKDVD
jgi:2-oxoglutarate ferredoxin oxidoreductase subunit beta